MLYGIGRLNDLGISTMASIFRTMNNGKVIFHCRGENAVLWAHKFKRPNDKILLDLRGYWPAELLYKRNIIDLENLDETSSMDFQYAKDKLSKAIVLSDGVSAVSFKLLELLKIKHNLNKTSYVVPCCSQESANNKGHFFRRKWGVKKREKLIIYSGTTAPYQHLDDLTLPFLKTLVSKRADFKVLLLTPDPEDMTRLVSQHHFPKDKLIIDSLSQQEVALALAAGDAGVLIRKPTLVNMVSQPVKVAEYLLAGLPIIFENGTGGIPENLEKIKAGVGINISQAPNGNYSADIERVINFLETYSSESKSNAVKIGNEQFLLKNQINKHLMFYRNVLAI